MSQERIIKVCHFSSVHKRGDQRILYKECVSLLNAGYDVSLIVADGGGNDIANGIKVYDVGKEKKRTQRFTRTQKKIFSIALELDCDVYHFHDPELLFTGLKLKRKGKKVIWDMHENLPADIMQKGYIPLFIRKLITAVFKKIEKYTVKRIDGVICTRDSVLHRLNGLNDNLALVNNFPLIDYEVEINDREERTICFAGTISPNYQHKEIIQAIEQIDNVKYLLAGSISERHLSQLKALPGWKKVEYLGVLPFEEVKSLFARSSIGVAIHKYTHNMDWQIGNFALTKIFEVMYWKMPVICTDYSLWEDEIFEKYKCGITVIPTNVDAIRESIQYLLDNPEEARSMGETGHKAVVESFNWKSQEKRLLKLYSRI